MNKAQKHQEIVNRLIAYAESAGQPDMRAPLKPALKKAAKTAFDEESHLLMISDLQAGHMTKTFNFQVLRARLTQLTEKFARIVARDRLSHPVDDMHIFLLGDIVHGERVGLQVSLDELEDTVSVQIFDVCVPALTSVLHEAAGLYKSVNVWCVRGNHGSTGKFGATTTNWDDVVYKFLESKLQNHSNIKFHIAENFYQLVDVQNTRFLIAHGDQIKMYLNIPFYGLTNRSMRWQDSIGRFDAMAVGHFHVGSWLDWNHKHIYTNGTLVTNDDWCIKNIGMGGSCMQLMLSVHPKQGVTDMMPLWLH